MQGEWKPTGINLKEAIEKYMEYFFGTDEGKQFLKEVIRKNTEKMTFETEIHEEATMVIQEHKEEWWLEPSLCKKCEKEFMAPDEGAKYCPYCGRKIVGVSDGKRTIYDFNEEEEKNK